MMRFAHTLILRAATASRRVMIMSNSSTMLLKMRRKWGIRCLFTWRIQWTGSKKWKRLKPSSKNRNLMCLIIISKIFWLLIVEAISWTKRKVFLYIRNIFRWMRRTKGEGSNRRQNGRKDRKRWKSCKNESQPKKKPRLRKQERRPFRLLRKNSTSTTTYLPWRTPSKTLDKRPLLPASSQRSRRANDTSLNYSSLINIIINKWK